MKRTIALVLIALASIAYASAQNLLSNPESDNAPSITTIEYIENDNTSSMDFEVIVDASFLTERDVESIVAQFEKDPDQTVAALLNILLGGIGIGHFYTGQTLRGVLDIIFCWTGIPAIIGLVEGIIWLCDDEDEWAARVAKWNEK